MQLSLAAQINTINEITTMAHISIRAGNTDSAVQLLSKAQGMIATVLSGNGGPVAGGGLNEPSHSASRPTVNNISSNADDLRLLDEISIGQVGKVYSKVSEAQQVLVRQLAGKVLGREVKVGEDKKEGTESIGVVRRTGTVLRGLHRTYAGSPSVLHESVGRGSKEASSDTGKDECRTRQVARQITYQQWLRENGHTR
jgi:hypothetical protein